MSRARRLSPVLVFALIGPLGLALVGTTTACSKSPSVSSSQSASGSQSSSESASRSHQGEHGEHGEHGKHGEHGDHDPLVHRFDKAEDWATRFDAPDRDAWQKPDQVIAQLAIEPGMTVADIGAGTGYFLPHLSRAVGASGAVLGLDIEKDMVRYMTERVSRENLANVEARQVAGDDPQLAAASVDRILVVNTWHHIPGRERYADKLASALRPGGAIYIVDFTLDSERGPPREHKLAPDIVARELAQAGLAVETRSDALPEQYIVVARLKK